MNLVMRLNDICSRNCADKSHMWTVLIAFNVFPASASLTEEAIWGAFKIFDVGEDLVAESGRFKADTLKAVS